MIEIGDADRLAAEGIPLEIAGHAFHARWSNRAMFAAEKRYGSVTSVGTMLRRVGQPANNGDAAVPLFETTFEMLALSLRHESVAGPNGSPVPVTVEWLLDNADPRQVLAYLKVASDAFAQALPGVATEQRPTTPSETTAMNPTTGSPGDDSAGSPSPSSEPPSTPSGIE